MMTHRIRELVQALQARDAAHAALLRLAKTEASFISAPAALTHTTSALAANYAREQGRVDRIVSDLNQEEEPDA